MPKLYCTVSCCANYSEEKCCRSDIHVDGSNARHCSDTCCASFLTETNSASNSVRGTRVPNAALGIGCTAGNCIYNQDMKCTAPEVQIRGGGSCCTCTETECATFKAR